MGGYEGADHLNGGARALDMSAARGHADQLKCDHRGARDLGIASVRESIGWRLSEPRPGCYDFVRLRLIAHSARNCGQQVLWSLMHYGTPPDVDLLDDASCDRFVHFAVAVARELAALSDEAPVYNLINEPSFLAWAVSSTNLVHPYRGEDRCRNEAEGTPHSASSVGYALKRRLVRMSLMAMQALRETDPRARFMHIDPLVHVAAPPGRTDLAAAAARQSDRRRDECRAAGHRPQRRGHGYRC